MPFPDFWGERHLGPEHSDIDAWSVPKGARLNQFGEVQRSDPDPPRAYVLCNDPEHNRHTLGVIIHPAEKAGEYYRVGLFSLRAGRVGGTQFFKSLDVEGSLEPGIQARGLSLSTPPTTSNKNDTRKALFGSVLFTS